MRGEKLLALPPTQFPQTDSPPHLPRLSLEKERG